MLASMLGIANEEEIQLARLAINNAHDSHVKAFAEKMAKDHESVLSQLEKFGARPMLGIEAPGDRLSVQPGAGGDARQTGKADNGAPNADTNQQPGAPGSDARSTATDRPRLPDGEGGLDFVTIKRQIAQQGIRTAQHNWETNDSALEHDLAYMGQQVVMHQQMLDALKVLRQYASPNLQTTITGGTEMAEEHLQSAKELIKSLAHSEREAAPGRGTAQDPNNGSR